MKDLQHVFVAILFLSGGLTAADTSRGGEAPRRARQDFDILVVNARIVDGTGNPWYRGEVGIRNGLIEAIGKPRLPAGRDARRVLDVGGAVLAPGFIDAHSHSDFRLLADGRAPSKVRQGITTEVLGESHSPGPYSERLPPPSGGVSGPVRWRTLGGFLDALEQRGIAPNVCSYVGSGQVWECVMGEKEDPPSEKELLEMERLVEEAMEDGAMGLSSSLLTRSGRLQSTAHLVRLARVAARAGGIYAVHIRSEGEEVLRSIEEMVEIGVKAEIPVEIFHLKIADHRLWGHMADVGRVIEAARARGVEIAANQYPYTAGMNDLSVMLPPWALAGGNAAMLERLRDAAARERMKVDIRNGLPGWYSHFRAVKGWEGVLVSFVHQESHRKYEGKTFDKVLADRSGKDPLDVLFDFIVEEGGSVPACFFHMSEDDVRAAMAFPWVSIGSDGSAAAPDGPLSGGSPHPRWYGTFPRVLGTYVRELRILTLEDAVRKMTSANALKLGLRDRGIVAEGMAADLVVFQPERVADRATFGDPHRYPEGIPYVIVNGRLVVDGEAISDARPGRALRGPGFRERRG